MVGMEQVLEASGPADIFHCCRNSSEKVQRGFIIIRMRNQLLKEQFQMQFIGTSFCSFMK